MTSEDPQKIWEEYYKNKKSQRMQEASELWNKMVIAGVEKDTILAIDFLHFGTNEESVKNLGSQLSENYKIEIVPGKEKGYWYAKGTTRPYGINLSGEEHSDWVEFMFDVSKSYGCLFSTWSVEAKSLGQVFESESIEKDI